MKELKDFLHLYLGCQMKHENGKVVTLVGYIRPTDKCIYKEANRMWNEEHTEDLQPILRPLSDMKAEDMIGLLMSTVPADMEDAPEADEWDVNMFYNDGGGMVDGNCAVGADFSCRCHVGQIAINLDGSINYYGEDGELERSPNHPQAFLYLLSKGFDLFGLLDSGIAISKEKL